MKKREIRDAFVKKYKKEIVSIFEKYEVDTGVCIDMLVALSRGNQNYLFEGYEKVDLEELKKDVAELELNMIVPKLV